MTPTRRYIIVLLCVLLFPLWSMAQSTHFNHTVKKGETVYSLARIYKTTIDEIYTLNPNAKQGLKAGEILRIPQQVSNANQQGFHTIKPGETLYRISIIYKVSAAEICAANPGLSAENFKAGQVIVIPTTTTSVEQPTTPVLPEVSTPQPAPNRLQPKCREMHKVGRREKLSKIAEEYAVSEEEIIAANPEMKEPGYELKKGSFICIPYRKQVEQAPKIPTNEELFPPKAEKKSMEHIKMAVVLPFKENNSKSAKMIEFYQGILLAVDSIKSSGVSVEVFAYDSGADAEDMTQLLSTPELKKVDIIFGPMYAAQINTLSKYCKRNKIKLVVPFTGQSDEFYNNPYIYAINAPKNDQYHEVNLLAENYFVDYNHVILDAEDNNTEGKNLADGLKKVLKAQDREVATMSLHADEMTLLQTLNPVRKNLIIPNTSDLKVLNKLFPLLKNFANKHPEYKISLLGYPEWQTYTGLYSSYFHIFDTFVFTTFYRNAMDQGVVDMENRFTQWFTKPMFASYPRFGLLGFDAGYFFLKGMSQYGKSFNDHILEVNVKPMQHAFRFQRASNWSGFINREIQLIHYSTDQRIELIRLKR